VVEQLQGLCITGSDIDREHNYDVLRTRLRAAPAGQLRSAGDDRRRIDSFNAKAQAIRSRSRNLASADG
jgi:hypothetical protein